GRRTRSTGRRRRRHRRSVGPAPSPLATAAQSSWVNASIGGPGRLSGFDSKVRTEKQKRDGTVFQLRPRWACLPLASYFSLLTSYFLPLHLLQELDLPAVIEVMRRDPLDLLDRNELCARDPPIETGRGEALDHSAKEGVLGAQQLDVTHELARVRSVRQFRPIGAGVREAPAATSG